MWISSNIWTQPSKPKLLSRKKSRRHSGNVLYLQVEDLLSSRGFQKYAINTRRNTTFRVVYYWCETCSVTLRKEHRLRMLTEWVLRKTFGLERNEVTGDWRKWHTERFDDLYYTLNIIQVIKPRKSKMSVAFSMYGGAERCVQGLVEKSEVKRPLGYQDIFRMIILEWILN